MRPGSPQDRRSALRWLVWIAVIVSVARPGTAQEGFPGWVGLFHGDQIAWLENENRLSAICIDPAALASCVTEHLRPSVHIQALHRRPETRSPVVGDVIVVAVPGRGLSAHVRLVGAVDVAPFTPDLYLSDWGYGPYFHQTISRRRGAWFELPPGPWPEPVWIRPPTGPAAVVTIRDGDIVDLDGAAWYVVSASRDAVWVRPEQPADQWCQAGEPPPLAPVEPERRGRRELLDERGHLRITFTYPKGC